MQMSNNSGNAARTMSYDANGRLSADSGAPGAPYGGFTYDAEGEPLSYTAFSQTVTQNFTDRGEFQKQTFSSDSGPCITQGQYQGQDQQMVDGYPLQLTLDDGGTHCYTWSNQSTFNALTGLTVASGDLSANGTQFIYDNAGRQSSATTTMSGQNCAGGTCEPWSDSGSYTKQYDAENHLIGQTYSTWPHRGSFGCPAIHSASGNKGVEISSLTLTYIWGPNGHPVEAKNTSGLYHGTLQPVDETLHWDGDAVLFTTNSSGAVDDIKLEGQADIIISGGASSVSFDNRDFTGAEGTPPSPSRQMCNVSSSAYIFSPGLDSISDGYNIFQGIRNYDPVIGTWSTPDAYQGDVSDPMSQHPYMWNRNNAFLYEDPSGYCAEDACVGEGIAAGVVWLGLGAVAVVATATHHDEIAKGAGAAQTVNGNVVKSAIHAAGALFRNGGRTSSAQRGRIIQQHGTTCSFCGQQTDPNHNPQNGRSLEIDHYEPHSRGGSNGDDNKVPSCRDCNLHKGTTPGDQYRAQFPQGSQTFPY